MQVGDKFDASWMHSMYLLCQSTFACNWLQCWQCGNWMASGL